MNVWDVKQAIETTLPWWSPFVAAAVGIFLVAIYAYLSDMDEP